MTLLGWGETWARNTVDKTQHGHQESLYLRFNSIAGDAARLLIGIYPHGFEVFSRRYKMRFTELKKLAPCLYHH
jgi:hypothetical protein